MTGYDWIVGDVLQHPDGRSGQVIELEEDSVVVRLTGGVCEQWPAHELLGTGVWLNPEKAGL